MREARTIRVIGPSQEMSYDLVLQTDDVYTHSKTDPKKFTEALQAAAEAATKVLTGGGVK